MNSFPSFNATHFYRGLIPSFERFGYIWHSPTQQFRSEFEGGFKNISIQPITSSKGISFNVQFGTRLHVVERTALMFLPTTVDYYNESNTAIIQLNEFLEEDEQSLLITSQKELLEMSVRILGFFQDRGFDHLEMLSDSQRLENLFNKHPNLPVKINTNQTYRCFRGIILARMLNNPRWNDVHKAYLHYLEANKVPQVQFESYMRLVEFLNSFGLN
ncbi:MAG: hypothetical protein HWE14_03195 [Flavobacteriia bacterium]|nr:hypothetical protein [Flavobacteriia bacterium]